jgi:hypothetical protein
MKVHGGDGNVHFLKAPNKACYPTTFPKDKKASFVAEPADSPVGQEAPSET